MKTKAAVLNGKPEAGNPHVRFGEGADVSYPPTLGLEGVATRGVKSRRGALLCGKVGALAVAGLLCWTTRAEVLSVDRDMTIDADATYSGIAFQKSYTLSGVGKVIIEDGGTGISVPASATATIKCPVQMGSTDSGESIDATTLPLAVGNGATLTFDTGSCISGDAKISSTTVSGGTINLKTDNTFNGTLEITEGVFNVYADKAFGSTVGKTTFSLVQNPNPTSARMHFYAVTTSEDIEFECKDISSPVYFHANGDKTQTVFNGTLTGGSNYRWYVYKTAQIVFNGPNKMTGCNCIGGEGGRTTDSVIVNGPWWAGHWYSSYGPYVFNGQMSGSSGGGGRGLWTYGATYKFGRDDVFSLTNNNKTYRYVLNVKEGAPRLELNGFDQWFAYVQEDQARAAIVNSEAEREGTLHFLNTTDTDKGSSFSGSCTGNAGLSFEGPKPVLINGISTSSGTLTITNGAAVAISALGGWGGKVRVTGEKSSLAVTNDAAFSATDSEIRLEDGGTMELVRDATYLMKELYINGNRLPVGLYPAGSAAFEGRVTGAGTVNIPEPVVETVAWTWQGGDNTALDLAANWVEEGVPDFSDGSPLTTFGTVGSLAAFAGAKIFKGIRFDAADGFTLQATADGSEAEIRSLGVVATGAKTYTFDTPVRIGAAQTWEVGADATLVCAKPLVSAGSFNITKTGEGKLVLSSAGTRSGSLFVDAGTLDLVGDAASPSPDYEIRTAHGANLTLRGGTFANPLNILWSGAHSNTTFRMAAGTTNVCAGTVNFNGQNEKLYLEKNADLTFGKPIMNAGYQMCVSVENATGAKSCVRFKKASNLSNFTVEGNYATALELRFEESGFGFGVNYNVFQNNCRVICGADYVFNTESNRKPALQLGGQTVFDLNGHDQRVDRINGKVYGVTLSNASGAITSATPATLYDLQSTGFSTNNMAGSDSDNHPFPTKFTGAVSFSKGGTKELYLAGVSSTTGRLEVTGGVLGFAEGGSWLDASEVRVLGGTLKADAANRFGKIPALYLSPDGKLEIASGVTVRAKKLYVPDGRGGWMDHAGGSFTKSDLPAYLAGEGTLRVSAGAVLIFR